MRLLWASRPMVSRLGQEAGCRAGGGVDAEEMAGGTRWMRLGRMVRDRNPPVIAGVWPLSSLARSVFWSPVRVAHVVCLLYQKIFVVPAQQRRQREAA